MNINPPNLIDHLNLIIGARFNNNLGLGLVRVCRVSHLTVCLLPFEYLILLKLPVESQHA